MNEENKFIEPDDSIYEVVTKYPAVRARLLELSKKYERLNNPVIFNTVAKFTSVKKAASVGGFYWKEFVFQLNDAIGLGKEYVEKSKKDAFSAHGKQPEPAGKNGTSTNKPQASWMDKSGSFEVMDVRDGGEPFDQVSAKAKTLKSGEGFVLVQVFEPQPLIGYLATLGFEHETVKANDAEFRVYFYKK